jgi:hypothetical protein
MLLGKTTSAPLAWPPAEGSEGAKDLFHLALGWLKEDKVVRKEREKVTGRVRGPKAEVRLSFVLSFRLSSRLFSSLPVALREEVEFEPVTDEQTTDAKTFFEKYDYSH